MASFHPLAWIIAAVAFSLACLQAAGAEKTEHFDKDPQWDGRNHRAVEQAPREVRQDFGYSHTAHAGGKPGEIGGFITPASEAAFYGAKIPKATFDTPLSASGTLMCSRQPFHVLLGFFNADTLNEWRTPNTIALRLNGRGDVFLAYVEYCTGRWRAGGDSPQSFPAIKNPETGRSDLQGFAAGNQVHTWSLEYDPAGNDGQGVITATLDGATAICNLDREHKADGATLDHFGLLTVMKSADSGGELWMDDITINDRRFDFSADPMWDALGNRRTFASNIVRPKFDFGFSPTRFAGGRAAGELGGVVFRGDCRYPERMAYYGDKLAELTLDKPLRAGGKVALRRGVSDSGVLIGFFDSIASTASNPSQNQGLPASFLGISTDAPSREGFYFSPTYRLADNGANASTIAIPPRILPDGAVHDWTLAYSPTGGEGHGQITLTFDDQSIRLPLTSDDRAAGVRFDRFGIISTWIDGNSQTIYFDDLTYTVSQD